MGRPTLRMNGLWSTLAVCMLPVFCLTAVDCVKLSKLASNTDRHEILPRSPRDEGCSGGTCLNGGTCAHVSGHEVCFCPSTHTGRYCERDNPCYNNPCQNGGSCFSDVTVLQLGLADLTVCFCREGWSGQNCEVAGPTSCMPNTCGNGGTCFSYDDVPFCECALGFISTDCEQIDPCSINQCPEDHVCVSIFGESHCVCVRGITGPDCVIDTDGDRNNCANNDPCLNGGTCDDTTEPGFKVCRCPLGYEGLYCEQEVMSSLSCNDRHTPCANGGTCQRYGNNYYCHCTLEYFGANCTESILYPFCLNYCQNGGSCYIDESAPQCACTPSWEGSQCEVLKHHTVTEAPVTINLRCLNYCKNGGTCNIAATGPRCTCTPNWEGRQCSVPTSHTTVKTAAPDCTLKCGDYGECQLKSNWDQYCRCKSGWNGDKCQNKDDNALDTPVSGSSVGAVVGGSIGGAFLLIIILVLIVVMISVSRARNLRRQQSQSQAVAYSTSVVSDPRFGNENRGFVHTQTASNPGPLPAKNLYDSSQANGSNMPRRYTQNAAQNNYATKEPSVIRNPASAYAYAYGAAPPVRKTSRSSVPQESHEYAYASGDYQPLRTPAAKGPPPSYPGAPSIAASAAPSIAASADHTYQSLSEFGDTGNSNKH